MSDDATSAPASATLDEEERLRQATSGEADWRLWGTYLAERQWGTVREDYSADGDAWNAFPYDAARSRAYRWGEDGLLGWTDRECRLCFATALWNGRDRHLKERLFGLSNAQGNHGEDVKELYYYQDALPSGAYAKGLYRYPHAEFPELDLVNENARRGVHEREYEVLDTGVFDGDRYFDVSIEYAKEAVDSTLVRLTVVNRGPERAPLTLLPTLTFRNTWNWGDDATKSTKPSLGAADDDTRAIVAVHDTLGRYRLTVVGPDEGTERWQTLFTGNDSNPKVFDRHATATGHFKDAFDRYVVERDMSAVDPMERGTKAALLLHVDLDAGASRVVRLRLAPDEARGASSSGTEQFDACFARRRLETDAFYASRIPASAGADERNVVRQAYAGLLWSKQVYRYDVERWLDGDPGQPSPAVERSSKRNAAWRHVECHDVISMPDGWEYPWFAAWDLAFHTMVLADIDPAFAKDQLLLMLSERYQHPNGAIPAYEYGFGDANPPVHAMAVWKVYEIDKRRRGTGDLVFLERAFLKLLLTFTWWLNRNDEEGKNLFGGGFLGLDNIGLFDRNRKLPDGTTLQQADATAWMGLFCASMLEIAFELRDERPTLAEMGLKFLHEYHLIIDAINSVGGSGLWDDEAGFFFDRVIIEGRAPIGMRVMSIVGLVPLFGIFVMRKDQAESLPAEKVALLKRALGEHPRLARYVEKAEVESGPYAGTEFLAIVPKPRLKRLLAHLLDESRFLSPFGIRSVSKEHATHPFELEHDGMVLKVDYVPGEGDSRAFGGNSNWRGPIWFPINVLILNALERYHRVYGDAFKVECPVGSGRMLTLREVADEIFRRLCRIFLKDASGARPCHGGEARYATDPDWKELVLFHEYFDGDSGRGLGASHQTGWTALIASCIARSHERADGPAGHASPARPGSRPDA